MARPDAARTLEASRRGFDRWAPTYEEDRRSRWIAEVQREALDALDIGANDRMLDVGCGSGAAVRAAAELAESAVGLDLSPGMIARARALAATLPNVRFVVSESARLPFEDGSFTAVLCTTSFHHYPDPERSVREMARVLASGGRLVIADPSADRRGVRMADFFLRRFDQSHVRLYRSSEMAAFFYGARLEGVEIRKVWSGAFGIIRGRKP